MKIKLYLFLIILVQRCAQNEFIFYFFGGSSRQGDIKMPTLVQITIKSGQKRTVIIPDLGAFDMIIFSVPAKDAITTLEKFGFEPKILGEQNP